MNLPHVLPFPRSRRRNVARAIASRGQFSDFSLSSIGCRRGPGRGGAPFDAPLSGSLPTRSSRGESGSLRILGRHNQPHSEKALTLIFFFASILMSAPAHLTLAPEQDLRMVAPPNAVSGRLPSIAPT